VIAHVGGDAPHGHGYHNWYQSRRSLAVGTTTPKAKPSVQTRFVLEAMAESDRATQERWSQVLESLEVLTGQVKDVQKVQLQLMTQVDLAAGVTERAAEERNELYLRMEETRREIAQMRLEQMGRNLEGTPEGLGNRNGGRHPPLNNFVQGEQQEREGQRRNHQGPMIGRQHDERMNMQAANQVLPKMSFPKFAGEDPVVWVDKCLEYFHMYQVPQPLWVSAASIHMEQNAARWWQVQKLRPGMRNWQEFARAVESKFGASAYAKALRKIRSLKQVDTLENYVGEFDQARYMASMLNPLLDEMFFVTQFIYGLKLEIQGVVQMHQPDTVDKAVLLAQMQQEVLDKSRPKGVRQGNVAKQYPISNRGEGRVQQTVEIYLERGNSGNTVELMDFVMHVERNLSLATFSNVPKEGQFS
jgi:hypothetical protein